jgi:hypothetical protein
MLWNCDSGLTSTVENPPGPTNNYSVGFQRSSNISGSGIIQPTLPTGIESLFLAQLAERLDDLNPPASPAATPTVSQPSGSYVSSVSVALASATSGASIRYTTDGSTPTNASALYSGPLTFTTTTTLKAIAFASGFSASSVVTATYTITQPPSIGGVIFYQNTNFGGTAGQPLAKGSYTLSELAARGVPNDWASSAKVPAGWRVRMYADNNFSGASWLITSDTASFTPLSGNANDKMSSCRIE